MSKEQFFLEGQPASIEVSEAFSDSAGFARAFSSLLGSVPAPLQTRDLYWKSSEKEEGVIYVSFFSDRNGQKGTEYFLTFCKKDGHLLDSLIPQADVYKGEKAGREWDEGEWINAIRVEIGVPIPPLRWQSCGYCGLLTTERRNGEAWHEAHTLFLQRFQRKGER